MAGNVSDYMLRRLSHWGVRRVYGYPGDGINGIMGAFNRGGHELKFIQTRHEEMAAFMACAHAKFTGDVGVCLATSGPGAKGDPGAGGMVKQAIENMFPGLSKKAPGTE